MAQPAQQSRPQKSTSLAIASADPSKLNAHLAAITEHVNLVTPATVVGSLPEGFEVVMSAITVDARFVSDGDRRKSVSKEVYELPAGNGIGLAKVVLDRIAAAAGVEWTRESGRIDDGRDPNFVHYLAVGMVTDFDGTTRRISGEKIIDLREGSPALEAVRARNKVDATAQKQIRELRLFALEHAESKAKNRALRGGLGLKTAYSADELAKPFVVPRLMLTGYSPDPVRRREIADRIMDARLGSSRALYPEPPQPRLVPHASRTYQAPPPVGSVPLDEDDVPKAPPTPKAPAAPPARKAAPAAPPSGGVAGRKAGFVVTFGKSKGKDLAEVDDEDLDWLAGAFARSIDDPEKARFRENNERALAAVRAELAFRSGDAPDPNAPPPEDDDPTGGYGERRDDL